MPTDMALSTLTASSAPLGRLTTRGHQQPRGRSMTLAQWLAGRPAALMVWPEWQPRTWTAMPAAWRN